MTKNTTTAAMILSTLSVEAQATLRDELRGEVRAELIKELSGAPAPAPAAAPRMAHAAEAPAKTAKPAKAVAKVAKGATVQGSGRGRRQLTVDGVSPSDFIRAFPFDTKAREVIDAAAEVGLELSHALIHNTRAREIEKGNTGPKRRVTPKAKEVAAAAPAKAPKAKAAKEEASEGRETTKDGLSASAFVRKIDADRAEKGLEELSAAEVVEKGIKAGLTSMLPHTVYNTRKNVRKAEAEAALSARGQKAAATRKANAAKAAKAEKPATEKVADKAAKPAGKKAKKGE